MLNYIMSINNKCSVESCEHIIDDCSSKFWLCGCYFFFFFKDTATTEIYTLSLHDALPIYQGHCQTVASNAYEIELAVIDADLVRSEEHTSELQSPYDLVCRLLLEKKK